MSKLISGTLLDPYHLNIYHTSGPPGCNTDGAAAVIIARLLRSRSIKQMFHVGVSTFKQAFLREGGRDRGRGGGSFVWFTLTSVPCVSTNAS